MYLKKLSIPSPIVFGLLVLFSADQASARRCYACESTSGGMCWIEGNSAPIETSRLYGRSLALDSATSSANTTILEAMASLGHENSTSLNAICVSGVGPKYDMCDCSKFVGTVQGHSYVERSCTKRYIFCADYVRAAAKLGFNVTGCHRCKSDLCNSSTSINTGITSLVVFATLFFFQK
ncbi:uncharacterized protein LOC107982171 [Nasonia vitripennis]|uniref:Protein sleepless n=1 Tax=Nasonia vitripennis TaxID=7425 RepID=A0A7M7IUH2_NASVI|nr:uncharacterized protein LOC107982171 [Nasonia vitripennis]